MLLQVRVPGLLLLLVALPAAAQDKGLTPEELSRINVTTVGRRAEPLATTAAAVSVITSRDIRRAGITTLAEALRLVDGVHVARSSNAAWSITARGFNQSTANKLLVMVDGRTVYSPVLTGVFWNVIDYVLDDVDRIEVIRGPGAALWGANAVNGVINIITKHSEDTQGALVSISGGNEDRAIIEARYGGGFAAGTWRLYGKFADTDAQLFANGLPAGDDRRRGQAGFRVDGGDRGVTSWTVKGDAFHSRDGFTAGIRGEFTELDLQTTWRRALAGSSRLDLQSYYRREFRRRDGQLTHHVDIVDVDVQHSRRLARRHDVVWGGGFRVNWDTTHGSATLRFDPASRRHGLASLFVQDEIALLRDRWYTTTGVKWEHNSFSGGAIQPSVRTRILLPRGHLVWGAVSRAVRRPSRFEDDSVVPGPDGVPSQIGSDDFKSEILLSSEAGYRIRPTSVVSFDATIFRHNFTDLRSLDLPPVGTTPLVLGNSFEGHSQGVEVSANLQPVAGWRTHVGYTWLDTEVSARPGSRVVSAGASEANDPHNVFKIRTSIDLPRSFELDGSLRSVGELQTRTVPSVTALSVRLGWRATDTVELYISGQDITDGSHPEFGVDGPTRVEIQRSVRAGFTVRY
jgi:iron complex outermembrane recepter protein